MTATTEAATTAVSERAERLARWEARTNAWIIVSALLPIVLALGPGTRSTATTLVNIACWLVFVADLVVHVRLSDHYLSTRRGKFDLVIVLITAPWFLFTGGNAQFVVAARLARLGRVVMAGTRSNKLRHLVNQLGNVAIYALALLLSCAFIVYEVEPASSGFTTYGDAVWWGFVTLTTVGYGDLVPVTTPGRIAAVVLMLGGVAFLGTLAGTLSAFFGVGSDGKPVQYDDHGDVILVEDEADGATDIAIATPDGAGATLSSEEAGALSAEVAALRETIHTLVTRLDGAPPTA